jgi:predicted dehydrogenase
VCDRRSNVTAAAAAEHQIPPSRIFASAAELMGTHRPEFVIVATTAPSHCDLCLSAASSGAKYILCEKPFACSISECQRIIDECTRTGAKLAVNHQTRFLPVYTHAYRLLRANEFGEFASMSVIGGNGGLAMIGSHFFELFAWICQEPIKTVQAWFSAEIVPNPRGSEFEDRGGCVRATTASGKRLYFDLSTDQGHGITVCFTGRWGQILVDPLLGTLSCSYRQPEDQKHPTTRYATTPRRIEMDLKTDGMQGTRDLIIELLHGTQFPSARDGKHAVECLVAAYLSHENESSLIHLDQLTPFHERLFAWA